jgi:hypothetical protein
MSDERNRMVPFRGEEYLSALLLAMVIEYCADYPPERASEKDPVPNEGSPQWLNSFDIPANVEAILELAGQGLIEIALKEGTRISAKVLPAGEDLMQRLHLDKANKHDI